MNSCWYSLRNCVLRLTSTNSCELYSVAPSKQRAPNYIALHRGCCAEPFGRVSESYSGGTHQSTVRHRAHASARTNTNQ